MTSDAPDDLDGLLAAWGRAQRLSGAEADRIRQAIVPAGPALPAAWWTEFNSMISDVITRATVTPALALDALR
jgi:hypothetical protein